MDDEDQPSREAIAQLGARLERLERALWDNSQRLDRVEDYLRGGPPQQPTPPPTTRPAPAAPRDGVAPQHVNAPPADAHARESSAGGNNAHAWGRPFGHGPNSSVYGERDGARRAQAEGAAATHAPRARRDLENVIGGRAFAWAGIIAVAFAAAFFLKLAFESGYISPGVRVLAGGVFGLALLGAGELLRGRGLRHYAFVISGGGVLVLYLSIYAAHDFYHLISQPAAFALMAAVTAAAVLLSVRLDALAVAVLGLVGGFLTPVLLSTGQDNQVGLFTYVALLDAGVLALAYFKRWRSLNFLSFAATALMTLGWMIIHYAPAKLWTTVFFLTLFFVLYALLAVAHNLLPRRPTRWYDLLLAGANATFHYGLTYALLNDADYVSGTATYALAVASGYAALAHLTHRLHREDLLLAYGFVGAAVTFFTAAVAIQLELHWVTVAWSVEALMLTWAGLRANSEAVRRAALPLFLLTVLHWLVFDMVRFDFESGYAFVPLLNHRALSCAVLVAALLGAAWLYRRAGAVPESERAFAATLLTLTANALALVLLTQDVNDYFARQAWLARAADDPRAGRDYYLERLESARQFSLTVLWTVYGAGMLAFGVRRGARWARYAGLGLLVIATLKALAIDLSFSDAAWHAPLFNQTFMAFALLVAAYGLASRLYAKAERVGHEERSVAPALTVVAHALAVVALSAEASGYFASRIREGGHTDEALRDLRLAQQLSLSVIWAVYGGALFVAGRLLGSRVLRVLSLALLGLTTLKVFFWDLSSLDRVYRIISFIVLGLILLAVSFLYQKKTEARP